MQNIKYWWPATICSVLVSLSGIGASPSIAESKRPEQVRKNPAVTEWFKKYDQIRRDAEETNKEKCQSLFLGENKPDKNNVILATEMTAKYTVAHAAMKRLPSTPETRELQTGYIEYFNSARQLFSEFLKAEKTTPFSIKHLAPAKNRLQALDKSNKKLDAELRKKYGIAKHKHI